MGHWYTFKCQNIGCAYEKECSIGTDRGFHTQVQSMVCIDCKDLHNIAIGNYDTKGSYIELEKEKIKCPECHGNNLAEWKDDSCPKCGCLMIFDENEYILWD